MCAQPRDGQALRAPNADQRAIRLILPDRRQRRGGAVLLGDGGHASHGFASQVTEPDVTFMRPCHQNERGTRPHLAPIRQRIESIFWTRKDLLTLQRHRARTLARLKERVPARFCRLAAAIMLNHELGRPSRSLVDLVA